MKKHPRIFHPSEPRSKYPSIKDDVWDLEEDSPPLKVVVNRTLALDNEDDESTPVAADNSKYPFVNIILKISTYVH
jgi:hypothetical protein